MTRYNFNHLHGEDRNWAINNQFDVAEYCVRVKEGKQFGGPTIIREKCGDGSTGFPTRRRGRDAVQMELGLDGQLKRRNRTLVRPKSARLSSSRRYRRVDGSKCGLITHTDIAKSNSNPVLVEKRRKEDRKLEHREKFRGVNRNKVRRAARRNKRAQLMMSVY